MKEKGVENLEELTETLRHWQEIEDATVAHTTKVMDRTQNPLVRVVMEIIRRDSVTHKIVQQVILDSLEKQAFTLTPEELGEIWEMVEKHVQMEKETISLAEKGLRNCRLFVQRNLLTYLADDEQKHVRLLGQLESFKRSIYPYA
jgi:rubrerythrin